MSAVGPLPSQSHSPGLGTRPLVVGRPQGRIRGSVRTPESPSPLRAAGSHGTLQRQSGVRSFPPQRQGLGAGLAMM